MPYAPGGLTDVVARLYAEQLRRSLGQGVFVENKPGASGIIAIEEMARARPDGHTIMIGNISTNMFTPIQTQHALYVPPTRSVTVLSTAPAWERIGARWLTALGGVTLMEAGKQIYAATAVRAKRAKASSPSLRTASMIGRTFSSNVARSVSVRCCSFARCAGDSFSSSCRLILWGMKRPDQ